MGLTPDGWDCWSLRAVRDGCSRRVIGWAIDEHLHTDLVTSAQLARFADRRNLARSVGCTASAPVVDAFDPVADADAVVG